MRFYDVQDMRSRGPETVFKNSISVVSVNNELGRMWKPRKESEGTMNIVKYHNRYFVVVDVFVIIATMAECTNKL